MPRDVVLPQGKPQILLLLKWHYVCAVTLLFEQRMLCRFRRTVGKLAANQREYSVR